MALPVDGSAVYLYFLDLLALVPRVKRIISHEKAFGLWNAGWTHGIAGRLSHNDERAETSFESTRVPHFVMKTETLGCADVMFCRQNKLFISSQ